MSEKFDSYTFSASTKDHQDAYFLASLTGLVRSIRSIMEEADYSQEGLTGAQVRLTLKANGIVPEMFHEGR